MESKNETPELKTEPIVLIGDEAEKSINNKSSLPALPCGLLDWTEDEQKNLVYSGEQNDYSTRMQHKLGFLWQDWSIIRNNERLIKIVNLESPPESDDFFIKQVLVLWIDRVGKILGNTPIVEELTYHLRKKVE